MLKFGKEEKVRKMVETKLKNDEGEVLWVGNKITIYSVFAGVYGHEDGYVLTANTDKGYYPFPDAAELKELQSIGMIPNNLPKAEMNGMDLFGSYMLWWIMVPLVLWYIVTDKIKAARAARNPQPVVEPAPAREPGADDENLASDVEDHDTIKG